jgi:hypothetical protein
MGLQVALARHKLRAADLELKGWDFSCQGELRQVLAIRGAEIVAGYCSPIVRLSGRQSTSAPGVPGRRATGRLGFRCRHRTGETSGRRGYPGGGGISPKRAAWPQPP